MTSRDLPAGPDTAPGRRRPHADIVVALVIIAVCATVFVGTLGFEDVPAAISTGMGPGAFPQLVLGVIVVLALALAWTSRGRAEPEAEPFHAMVVYTGLGILGVMGVMSLVGIHGAVLASCLGLGTLWGERRWYLLLTVAVGLSVAIQLAFVRGFGVGLPRGVLQTWLM